MEVGVVEGCWYCIVAVIIVVASVFYNVDCSMDYVLKIIKGRDYLVELIYCIEKGIESEEDLSLFLVPKLLSQSYSL